MSTGSHGKRSYGKRKRPGDPVPASDTSMGSETVTAPATPPTKLPRRLSLDRPNTGEPDSTPLPTNRPPDAPFYPDAIEMWVLSDNDGSKRLVSEMVPGARHWRIGDPNVDFCVVCKEGGDLLGCHTCKRSYHRLCLTPPPARDVDHETFHCPTCTSRGWHINPPSDILPLASEDLPDVPTDSREAIDDVQNDPVTLSTRQQLGRSHQAHTQAFIQGQFAPTRSNPNPSTAYGDASSADQRQPSNKPGKRRSRYQTVSDEVDGAMSTIYRELESASELRSEIARLQDKVAKLEQERQIQEGKVALVREDLLSQTNAEMTWLRDEVAKLRAAHATLSTENEQLRAQIREAKLDSDTKLKEMDDMKARLREWLNN